MADITTDTSSYPKPQPAQNPLDQIMKVGQTADVLGNIEVGKGLQQAIQPDGTIDRNVLAQVLKGSVAGSMQAPKALGAIEQLRQAGHSADIEAIRNQVSQMDYVGKLLSPLANKDGVSKQELIDTAGKAIKNATQLGLTGYIPQTAQFLAQTNGDPSMTDAKRAQIVKDHFFQSQSVQRMLEAELPQGEFVDTGQRKVLVPTGTQLHPAFGTRVQQEIPPGVKQPNAQGQPTFRGTQPPSTGADYEPPGTSLMKAPSGTGVMPPRSQNMTDLNAQVVGRERTTYGVPTGGAAGLAPGQAAPMEASGTAYAKDLTDSRTYAERMNPLKQAIPLLEKSTTGPGTETIQHVKAFAQAMGLPVPNEKSITNYAEAKKYLSQNAASVAPPGTNIPSVLNAFEANPNMQQPKQAAVELSKMLYGLGRLRQASILAYNRDGPKLPNGKPDPAQYADWASQWSPQQDVRGYIADLMTPAQRKDLLSNVKKDSPQAKKISQSYQTAKGLGLLGDVERP